jgi:hypothetical protein
LVPGVIAVITGLLPTTFGVPDDASDNAFPAEFDATIWKVVTAEISDITKGEDDTPDPNSVVPSNE